MLNLIKADATHIDFINLVKLLDCELAISDGPDHPFYDQFNKIDQIKHVIIAYDEGQPVGCGAIKEYDNRTMEIKRMYVKPGNRGKRIATTILAELELWAKELNFQRCILETGINQPEAISLYKKCKYAIIPNYGQYEQVENSICFEKKLQSQISKNEIHL